MARPRHTAALAVAALLALASHAHAAGDATLEQALARVFPDARIERRTLALDGAAVKAIEARARSRVQARTVTVHVAWRGDSLAGAAFVDTRVVRTLPATFLTAVRADGTLGPVEVLAFHEPPEYRPPARWLGLFGGRRLDERLWPRRDVRNLSGASLSARAVTECARVALATWETQLADPLAAAPRSTR